MSRYMLMIGIAALITALTRFVPFLLFGKSKELPEFIRYLGKALPYAVMGMMLVYCLKGLELTAAPYGLPELIACLVVVGLHVWKRSSIISIVGGTVCYMLLVQLVF